MKQQPYFVIVVRRGVALGLALVSLWVLSLTANVTAPALWLGKLGQNQYFLVETMGQALSYQQPTAHTPLTNLAISHWGLLQGQATAPKTSYEDEHKSELVYNPPEQTPEEFVLPVPEPNWLDYTGVGDINGDYLHYDGIFVSNRGGVVINESEIAVFANQTLTIDQGAEILIYHSHATESYAQVEGATYLESDPYRTTDMSQNITQVGKAMAEVFEQAGYRVIHDTTLHDYPNYNASYSNSMASVSKILEENPNIKLVLDVHRDALETTNAEPYRLISQDQQVAQVMVVVGSNGGGSEHETWRANLALGVALQEGLLDYGDFARPIVVRSSRFNQHLNTNSLLIEVGGHGNTLQEAVDAGRLFAQSVVETMQKEG